MDSNRSEKIIGLDEQMIGGEKHFVTLIIAKERFQRVAELFARANEFFLVHVQGLCAFGRGQIRINVRHTVQRLLDCTGDFFDRVEKFAFVRDDIGNAAEHEFQVLRSDRQFAELCFAARRRGDEKRRFVAKLLDFQRQFVKIDRRFQLRKFLFEELFDEPSREARIEFFQLVKRLSKIFRRRRNLIDDRIENVRENENIRGNFVCAGRRHSIERREFFDLSGSGVFFSLRHD